MRQEALDTSEKVKALFGSTIKINSVLMNESFVGAVEAKHVQSRRPDAKGVVIAQPNQCGGDAFIVDHQDGTPPAPYWFSEFNPVHV